MMYALRDDSGQFVARSQSRAAAHRASREKKHLGSSVNRAAGKSSEMTVLLAAVGNPDMGQPRDIGVPRSMVPVDSFRSASNAVLGYIKRNDLGGGNWAGGLIFRGGKPIAHVSYNGRVWKGKSWKPGQEPIYEPGSANRTGSSWSVEDAAFSTPLDTESPFNRYHSDVQYAMEGSFGVHRDDAITITNRPNIVLYLEGAFENRTPVEKAAEKLSQQMRPGAITGKYVGRVAGRKPRASNRAGGAPRRAIVSNKGMMKGYWNVILDDAVTASSSEAKSYGGTLVEHGLSTKKSAQAMADEVNRRGSFMTGISGFRREEPL